MQLNYHALAIMNKRDVMEMFITIQLVNAKLIKSLTFPVSAEGNSDSNLLLSPNLQVRSKVCHQSSGL